MGRSSPNLGPYENYFVERAKYKKYQPGLLSSNSLQRSTGFVQPSLAAVIK